MQKVLVVDDEPELLRYIGQTLGALKIGLHRLQGRLVTSSRVTITRINQRVYCKAAVRREDRIKSFLLCIKTSAHS